MDPEDIKDPLNINNFWCMSYLEKKIPDLLEEQKASMAKGERPDAKTKKLWQECMKRRNYIHLSEKENLEALKAYDNESNKLRLVYYLSKYKNMVTICSAY